MPGLIVLVGRKSYLKSIEIGSGKPITEDDAEDVQDFADTYIEGKLGVTFTSPNIPKMIVRIADMIASSEVFKIVHNSQAPKQSDHAKNLFEQADKLLDQIIENKVGLVMPDGSFHPKYQGISKDVEEDSERDTLEIIY